MKKILFAAAMIGVSSFVLAGPSDIAKVTIATEHTVCDGKSGGGKALVSGGSGTAIDGATAVFTKNGFDVQCSSNTFVSFQEETANLAAVAAGSSKGNQAFGGHSNGGSILPGGAADKAANAKCTDTNDACKAGDISTVLKNAIAAGKAS